MTAPTNTAGAGPLGAAAYTLDGAPVARERFYELACDPARSVVVEACAGAGKTWMLVSRILRALLEARGRRTSSRSLSRARRPARCAPA